MPPNATSNASSPAALGESEVHREKKGEREGGRERESEVMGGSHVKEQTSGGHGAILEAVGREERAGDGRGVGGSHGDRRAEVWEDL